MIGGTTPQPLSNVAANRGTNLRMGLPLGESPCDKLGRLQRHGKNSFGTGVQHPAISAVFGALRWVDKTSHSFSTHARRLGL
jgi:hypothetical protein